MLSHREETLLLEGQGETEREALQHILGQVKTRLEVQGGEILLRIEPRDMKIVDASIRIYTEKFMGILFPRERKLYTIRAQVTVSVCSVLPGSIPYREEREKLSAARHVLEMR